MREAGDHTTWTDPDEDYENAVHAAVDAAIDSAEVREVLDGLVREVEAPGRSNSLAMKLLSITMPGVPDVYQGSEVGQVSLVDPDNRRPVDFDGLARLLAELPEQPPQDLTDARGKLLLTARLLELRRREPQLFARGAYQPLAAEGAASEHVVAYARVDGERACLVVGSRLPLTRERAGRGWGDTRLALPGALARPWRDVLTGAHLSLRGGGEATVSLDELLGQRPVAVLEG
jgi:(1->4)-alpha-D-glucan 1-alpha-D-glucosylmutase